MKESTKFKIAQGFDLFGVIVAPVIVTVIGIRIAGAVIESSSMTEKVVYILSFIPTLAIWGLVFYVSVSGICKYGLLFMRR